MSLHSNKLSGSIPVELGNLSSLQSLYLHSNKLSGSIPVALGNLSSLRTLYLHSNKLSGEIPVSLGNLNSLRNLYLQSNDLSGSIPVSLGNLNKIWSLNLANNNLSGEIPTQLGNFSNFNSLDVSNNAITSVGSLSMLERDVSIDISDNNLYFSSIALNLNDEDGNKRGSNYVYSPQGLLDTKDSIFVDIGNSVELNVSDDYAGNVYTWYKDGDQIVGAPDSRIYSIGSFSVSDTGNYWVGITNPSVAGLTLYRHTISLLLSGRSIDSLALVTLYNSTDGDNWDSNDKWLTSSPVSEWYGVTVIDDRVVEIDLNDNDLVGEVPVEIGNLSELSSLDVSNNAIASVSSLSMLGSDVLIDINDNNLGFSSIGLNLNDGDDNDRGNNYIYSPQGLLDSRDSIFVDIGNDVELSVSDEYAGNVYTWYKDGEEIVGAPDSRIYSIGSFSVFDMGNYWVGITNSSVAGIDFVS